MRFGPSRTALNAWRSCRFAYLSFLWLCIVGKAAAAAAAAAAARRRRRRRRRVEEERQQQVQKAGGGAIPTTSNGGIVQCWRLCHVAIVSATRHSR